MKYKTMLLPLLLAATPAFSAAPMQAGLWEITTSMEMPGMPAGMGAQTLRHCYNQKELEDSKNVVPKGDDKGQCEIKDYKMTGNKAAWTVQCKGAQQVTSTGEMIFGGASYTGSIKTRMKEGGQSMDMNQKISARRVGDCK